MGAVLLRVASGVGFANYDTLYALVWGQQLTRGETPQYGIPIAPTPHPLVEALGVVAAPLGPHAASQITVALGFLALSACGWAVYRLGALWFNRPAGAVAALLLLTREPILSYGVRAYVDVPYLLLVLSALIVETRRRRAGAPVLALLALAGLLRPEAWAFSGLYWLYLALPTVRARRGAIAETSRTGASVTPSRASHPASRRRRGDPARARRRPPPPRPTRPPRAAGRGRPDRVGGKRLAGDREPAVVADQHQTHRRNAAPRDGDREGARVHPAADRGDPRAVRARRGRARRGAGAAWLRARALPGALAGIVAVGVFAAFASVGLPIDTRYAFLAAAILCVFAGAAVCGWMELPRGDPHRRWWMAAAAVSVVALLASIPSQYRVNHHELNALGRQQRIQNELTALVRAGAITTRCEPIGVTNHAPVPLLALWLETPPGEIANLQVTKIAHGTFVDPANAEVQKEYILDPNDPHQPVAVPAGFTVTHTNRSWRILQRCAKGEGRGGDRSGGHATGRNRVRPAGPQPQHSR